MATESPMRMVETTGAKKWHSSKDSPTFSSPLKGMATEELGLLMKGQKSYKDQTEMIPNRSGSAPPSMEGSFAAIGNLSSQQDIAVDSSLENLNIAFENCESEEQLRSDPAYIAYYWNNVNLNPRLPPPLISRENQRLVRHIGGFGNNRKLISVDGNGDGSFQLSGGMLSPHKEEPENDRSLGRASDSHAESSIHVKSTSSLAGRHKSLVDLIQEDFPRTPSPVYNLSRSSIHATEEPADCDLSAVSLNISSVNISRQPECNRGSLDTHEDASTLDANSFGLTSTNDRLATSPDELGTSSVLHRDKSSNKQDASTSGSSGSHVTKLDSRMKALNDNNNRNKQEKKPYERNLPPRQSVMHCVPYQGQAQVISQGVNHPNTDLNKPLHGYPKFFLEGQPTLPSPGLAPPLYATTAAYMASGNPFYPFQPFAHLYSLGGYAPSSTFIPPLMAGYPSHGSVPLTFDANSGASVSSRSSGVSAGESVPHVSDLQNLSNFFGQQGLMLQPPFMDPSHMQYFHHPYEDAYGSSSQYGRMASNSGIGAQTDSFIAKKESVVASYIGDQKFHPPANGSLTTPNPRNVGIPSGNFYASPSSMGFVTQFPASPLASPVVPLSPVGGTSHPVWRNEMRFPMSPSRNSEGHPVWQGQRGANSDDSKRHSFLEELKSSNAQNFQLSDIVGRIVEFSADQHGSRFIQQKLENCSLEEKESVFREVLPHSLKLMTDVFGNYVIQKFFEHGSPELRKELANKLSGQMLHLSLQMYGCRVIQKALEVIELDQKIQLVNELDGHVIRCVRDQNGNHVIQKCIECVPADKVGFIISSFRGQVATLSTHPYGCRVIQRVLEHCSDEQQSQSIVDEILESSYDLAQDQYGNYVTQHVLERGKPHERSQIIGKLSGKIVQMSQHKYASNVIEKCLVYGDASERQLIINEIIGKPEENDHLLVMMKDQFANYVIQKILETCSGKQREILLNCIKVHLNALKKYTYGKHIVARYEQLSGEVSQPSET